MAETVQYQGTEKTYLDDWTKELAEAAEALGLPELTITDATVTADGGAAILAHSVLNTGVLFKLDSAGVAEGNIKATINVTLSNGDTDLRPHLIEIRPT